MRKHLPVALVSATVLAGAMTGTAVGAPGANGPHGGDATNLPGGGGVVMRTYSSAHLSAYPSWQGVETWTLPAQDLTFTNELFPLPKSGLQVTFSHVNATVSP